MTQEFDGPALSPLNRAYGLSGINAEQQTFLDDGNVQQVLDIGGIARRGRPGFSRNIFYGIMLNSHVGAGALLSFIDPYNAVNPANGYPAVIDPDEFDIYLLGMNSRAVVGGSVTWGMAGFDRQSVLVGLTDTAAGGAASTADQDIILGAWTDYTTITNTGTGIEFALDVSGRSWLTFKERWPADTPLTFRSLVTGATDVFCEVKFGIAPAALGQDVW